MNTIKRTFAISSMQVLVTRRKVIGSLQLSKQRGGVPTIHTTIWTRVLQLRSFSLRTRCAFKAVREVYFDSLERLSIPTAQDSAYNKFNPPSYDRMSGPLESNTRALFRSTRHVEIAY